MKKLYLGLLGSLLALMLAVGILSLVDKDPTISLLENRELASKPDFSWGALWEGAYVQELEAYYTDTFPFREQLLGLNRKLNQFYYYSGGDNNYLAIDFNGGAEQGGESLHDVENALSGNDKPGEQEQPGGTEGDVPPDGTQGDPDTPPEEERRDPEIALPDESQAAAIGTIIVVGDNAMDIPTASGAVIESYAGAINNLAAAMGPDVRTISLVTPNSGEFYSPESFHTGQHSQKDMIDACYAAMSDQVLTVDAYAALREHADEYIYFRTDHHWTALGAYYAYVEYCRTVGLEPVALDQFQTGTYENFLGSMYTYTQGYPQSDALAANPDTLTYYLPIAETHAKYYSDTTLSDGIPISVVYTKIDESVSNKYLCFIGGDTPICIVETDVEGPVCMVVKESYGNAFVPFLTSHYSKIIVIDPRKFNQEGMPALNIAEFGQSQGVDDLLVINYPFMINNSYYVEWLNRLVR